MPPPHFLVESLVSVSAYSNMNFHAPKKWAAILFHPEGCIYLRQVLNCSISHGRRVYCWTPGGGELIAVEVSFPFPFPFHHFLSDANEQGATCPQNLIGKICWISIVDFSGSIPHILRPLPFPFITNRFHKTRPLSTNYLQNVKESQLQRKCLTSVASFPFHRITQLSLITGTILTKKTSSSSS